MLVASTIDIITRAYDTHVGRWIPENLITDICFKFVQFVKNSTKARKQEEKKVPIYFVFHSIFVSSWHLNRLFSSIDLFFKHRNCCSNKAITYKIPHHKFMCNILMLVNRTILYFIALIPNIIVKFASSKKKKILSFIPGKRNEKIHATSRSPWKVEVLTQTFILFMQYIDEMVYFNINGNICLFIICFDSSYTRARVIDVSVN